jgi:hypothetical protein
MVLCCLSDAIPKTTLQCEALPGSSYCAAGDLSEVLACIDAIDQMFVSLRIYMLRPSLQGDDGIMKYWEVIRYGIGRLLGHQWNYYPFKRGPRKLPHPCNM